MNSLEFHYAISDKYSKCLFQIPHRFFYLVILVSTFLIEAKSQFKTTMPTPSAASFTNHVSFNMIDSTYDFIYEGSDGTLKFEYRPSLGGSFNAINCVVDGSYSFLPSNFGGMDMMSSGKEIYPWSDSVAFHLLKVGADVDTLTTSWEMIYGQDTLSYSYKMSIAGRTLAVKAKTNQNISPYFYLDRTENTKNSTVINIPYLPYLNVLLTNNYFLTTYFDWEVTNSSDIVNLNYEYSPTSIYFGQKAEYFTNTAGKRNTVSETVYFAVSPSLPDVLPNIPNPVSPYKDISFNYIIFDVWDEPFESTINTIHDLKNSGINNLWIINHCWQNAGYDNEYPDVLPASNYFGGDQKLKTLSAEAKKIGYLFSLHENYFDFYIHAPSWNPEHISLNMDGTMRMTNVNPDTHEQAYHMKPSVCAEYINIFAPKIHDTYLTQASYLDCHSAAWPGNFVDFDARIGSSGKFNETLRLYRKIPDLLRNYHHGPVSGEGRSHYLFVGYFDDIEAEITSSKQGSFSQGYWLPLLVDFDLRKMHSKILTHGVAYYERFYSNELNEQIFKEFTTEDVLIYMATEIAYGHGGFIQSPHRIKNLINSAKLEYTHVFPVQKLYANARPVSILYNDNGEEINVSEYIKRHPNTFSEISQPDFMSQVRIVYDNGVVVCVNRHPEKQWLVSLGEAGGWYNFHAIIENKDSLSVGKSDITTYLLPPKSGWVVFSQENPNRLPVITSSPDTSAQVGQLYNYQVKVTDPDNDNFVYRLTNRPSWLSIDTLSGLIYGTPSAENIGDSLVSIFVVDSKGGITSQGYILNISNPTNTPVEESVLPLQFNLHQSFPNPCISFAVIKFDLPITADTKLKIVNSLGEEVITLVNEKLSAGYYSVLLSAQSLSSGIYFCRMETGSYVQINKILVLK
jgi:hypothetical protein